MEQFEFDEENHIYKLNGIIIPSVSEIIKPIHQKVYENISEHSLEIAADRGTRVHRAIEFWNKYDFYNVDEDCNGYLEAYKTFRSEHQSWKLLNSELRTYHKNLLYGMTIDEIYQTEKGIIINDIKTASQSHLDAWAVQLGGYKAGYESRASTGKSRTKSVIEKELTIRDEVSIDYTSKGSHMMNFNHVSKTTILQLFSNGKYALYDVKDDYFMFLACLQIYKFNERSK